MFAAAILGLSLFHACNLSHNLVVICHKKLMDCGGERVTAALSTTSPLLSNKLILAAAGIGWLT